MALRGSIKASRTGLGLGFGLGRGARGAVVCKVAQVRRICDGGAGRCGTHYVIYHVMYAVSVTVARDGAGKVRERCGKVLRTPRTAHPLCTSPALHIHTAHRPPYTRLRGAHAAHRCSVEGHPRSWPVGWLAPRTPWHRRRSPRAASPLLAPVVTRYAGYPPIIRQPVVPRYGLRGTYGTPEADTRTVYVPWSASCASCPVPPVRTARRRLVRAARTVQYGGWRTYVSTQAGTCRPNTSSTSLAGERSRATRKAEGGTRREALGGRH